MSSRGATAGQLHLHYQPQTDLATGLDRGVEASSAGNTREQGTAHPLSSSSRRPSDGLIGEIGRFVLERPRQWREWRHDGLTLDIAVNLSAVDLLDPRSRRDHRPAARARDACRVPRARDHRAHAVPRRAQRAQGAPTQLDRIGVRLAIDDYGTGYSSLACFASLPVQQVKIDRSFVSGIPGDREQRRNRPQHHPARPHPRRHRRRRRRRNGDGARPARDARLRHRPGLPVGHPCPADELVQRLTIKPALRVVA